MKASPIRRSSIINQPTVIGWNAHSAIKICVNGAISKTFFVVVLNFRQQTDLAALLRVVIRDVRFRALFLFELLHVLAFGVVAAAKLHAKVLSCTSFADSRNANALHAVELRRRIDEVRHGFNRVVIRDGDAIGALLTRLGAHESVLAWEERRMRREVRATANRLANFDDANLRRSARAAVAASARVARAMEILGEEIPEHLKEAGELRITHGQASLEELGSLASPPMTKDAIAGRIRRLLAMADKRAHELGIPDTEAGLSPDLLGD